MIDVKTHDDGDRNGAQTNDEGPTGGSYSNNAGMTLLVTVTAMASKLTTVRVNPAKKRTF